MYQYYKESFQNISVFIPGSWSNEQFSLFGKLNQASPTARRPYDRRILGHQPCNINCMNTKRIKDNQRFTYNLNNLYESSRFFENIELKILSHFDKEMLLFLEDNSYTHNGAVTDISRRCRGLGSDPERESKWRLFELKIPLERRKFQLIIVRNSWTQITWDYIPCC